MRLFVGLPAPASPAYRAVTDDLVAGVPGVKPVPDGTWHVTLRFLGEVADPAPVADALRAALVGARGPACTVRGVGAFQSPRKARVAWAGVLAPGAEGLERRVRAATMEFGEPPDDRDFRPHVTLARLRDPQDVSAWVARHRDTPFAAGHLDTLVLFRSEPTPHGSRYTRLLELALPAAPRPQP